jgi:hypothetical protein
MSKNKNGWKVPVPRPSGELQKMLKDHLDDLLWQCRGYDEGRLSLAAAISAHLRVLLLDDSHGKSLLSQAGLSRAMLFDSTLAAREGNERMFVSPMSGLAFTAPVEVTNGIVMQWFPALDFHGSTGYRVELPTWWEQQVVSIKTGQAFSRRRIVRSAANLDRGTHVDPILDKAYAELSRDGGHGPRTLLTRNVPHPLFPGGWVPTEQWIEVPEKDAGTLLVGALLRQIAHEVLVSLLPDPSSYLASLVRPNVIPGTPQFIDILPVDQGAG